MYISMLGWQQPVLWQQQSSLSSSTRGTLALPSTGAGACAMPRRARPEVKLRHLHISVSLHATQGLLATRWIQGQVATQGDEVFMRSVVC